MRLFRLQMTVLLAAVLTGCFPNAPRLRQEEVITITWRALQPNTSSQTRNNWEIAEIGRVYGREVVSEFTVLKASNCPGPRPPENGAIRSASEYWYVRAVPRQRTPVEDKETPPNPQEWIEPEPLFVNAQFLIDPFSGKIVARQYLCQTNAL